MISIKSEEGDIPAHVRKQMAEAKKMSDEALEQKRKEEKEQDARGKAESDEMEETIHVGGQNKGGSQSRKHAKKSKSKKAKKVQKGKGKGKESETVKLANALKAAAQAGDVDAINRLIGIPKR